MPSSSARGATRPRGAPSTPRRPRPSTSTAHGGLARLAAPHLRTRRGAFYFLNGEALRRPRPDRGHLLGQKARVEVKHAAGKFIKDLVLGKDRGGEPRLPDLPHPRAPGVEAAQPRRAAPPRRRGGQDPAEPRPAHDPQLHHRAARGGRPDPRAGEDGCGQAAGAGTDPDLVRKVTERLATAVDAQGFLIALLPEERLQRRPGFYLLAAGNTTAEAVVAFARGGLLQRRPRPARSPLRERAAVERAGDGGHADDRGPRPCCGWCPRAPPPRPACSRATW